MPDSGSAQWIVEVMTLLNSPDAELMRDLLKRLASLQALQPQALASPPPPPPQPSAPATLATDSRGGRDRESEVNVRREAIYKHLQENWRKVRDLPCCLKQAQVLRETAQFAVHSQILLDPIADDEATPLPLAQAKIYAYRATEIAEDIGDSTELIEAYLALGCHLKLTADFEEAQRCATHALALAEKINSLRHQSAAYSHLQELLTLRDSGPTAQIDLLRRHIDVLGKRGDSFHLTLFTLEMARLMILTGDLAAAAEELHKAGGVIEHISSDERGMWGYADDAVGRYHRYRALLCDAQGQAAQALVEMQKVMACGARSERYRSYVLGTDLIFLEDLYLRLGDEAGFTAFCRKLKGEVQVPLEYWHLSREVCPTLSWDVEGFGADSPDEGWQWIDPLGKGAYALGDGLEIAPVMGTGFLSNVYAPRLMQEVEGDFTFETILDYREGLRRAGGILVYQDDNTLIRYGGGIHYDGEITLTAKSPDKGFCVVARGLLKVPQLTLRLSRQGGRFQAWCGDGGHWYRCGQAKVPMRRRIQVGLFAECAYRDWFSVTRCTAAPVRFGASRLKIAP